MFATSGSAYIITIPDITTYITTALIDAIGPFKADPSFTCILLVISATARPY